MWSIVRSCYHCRNTELLLEFLPDCWSSLGCCTSIHPLREGTAEGDEVQIFHQPPLVSPEAIVLWFSFDLLYDCKYVTFHGFHHSKGTCLLDNVDTLAYVQTRFGFGSEDDNIP